jgi:hypothetical protein
VAGASNGGAGLPCGDSHEGKVVAGLFAGAPARRRWLPMRRLA